MSKRFIDGATRDVVVTALGPFKVSSDSLVVSDPCYDRGTWCMGFVSNVNTGIWNGEAHKADTSWSNRIVELHAYHESINGRNLDWARLDHSIGVDSGQAGIFDNASYNGGQDDELYDVCCDITLKAPGAGTLDGGVVSSSGFGDGSYSAYVARNAAGKVVAVKIVFIDDESDIDDDDV